MRKAEECDITLLYTSVNKTFVEKGFCNDIKIKENYYKWYLEKISSNDNLILIIENKLGDFQGFVRLEKNKNKMEIMLFVKEQERKKGIGYEAVKKSLEEYCKGVIVFSKILEENIASIKIFERLGFQYKGTENEYLIYEKDC